MKKIKLLFIYFIVILIVIVSSSCGNGDSTTVDKNKLKSAVQKENNNIEASGVIRASNVENIDLNFPTEITKINVKEGQKVKKGDSLVSLNIGEITNEINGKISELDSVKLELKNAERDRNALDREYPAGTGLPNTNETPLIDKDDLKYKDDNTISMLKDKVAITQNDLNILKGKINESYIKDNNIICNMDNAVVTEISYRNGDIVSPSQKVLTLSDMTSLYIEAKVDEEFSNEVQIGKPVVIKVVADSSKKYTGKIISVPSSATTNNGETYLLVSVSIDNKDDFLIPNYNVDLEISLK